MAKQKGNARYVEGIGYVPYPERDQNLNPIDYSSKKKSLSHSQQTTNYGKIYTSVLIVN